MSRKGLCLALSLVLPLAAYAQAGLPRLAVIPLNPVSVSKADATAFTGLVETALVKTEAFTVLEQGQVNVILEAQERSVADCTDEKCAVEFGKLLAAEQIVLGSISSVGGKLIVNAKIIDVATSRTLRADTVEAASLSDLTGQMELLAYKLAGLTFKEGGQEQVARAFGELFVETVPDDADLSLNGLPKGKSPGVLERVPLGRVTLEARKDNLYAVRDVDVTAEGLQKVKLELKVSLGNLFIKSSVKEGIRVSLDGSDVGPFGTGLLEDVPAGDHRILLSGNGYLWEGLGPVQTGKTVTVEAFPREVGSVSHVIPVDAQAEISARDYRMVVRGSGTLGNVPAGTYTVRVTGTDYEPLDLSLTVSRAATVSLAPTLKRPEAYEKRVAYEALSKSVGEVEALAALGPRVVQADVDKARAVESEVSGARWSFPELLDRARSAGTTIAERFESQERSDAEGRFRLEVERLSGIASWIRAVGASDVAAARELEAGLKSSRFEFPDLVAQAEALVPALEKRAKVDELTVRRDELEGRIARTRTASRGLKVTGGILLGVGVAGTALGVVSYFLGRQAYAAYDAATYSPDAEAAWAKVSLFSGLVVAGVSSGGGGLGVGLALVLAAPSTKALDGELAGLRQELAGLEGEGK